MFRFASFAVLGLALSFPIAASAAEEDRKPIEVAAVSTVDATPRDMAASPARAGEPKEPERGPEGGVRGLRQVDPGVVRFHNPYAFPLQSLPIALPSFAGMGL